MSVESWLLDLFLTQGSLCPPVLVLPACRYDELRLEMLRRESTQRLYWSTTQIQDAIRPRPIEFLFWTDADKRVTIKRDPSLLPHQVRWEPRE